MASQTSPSFNSADIFAAVKKAGITGKEPYLDGVFQRDGCHLFKVCFQDRSPVGLRVRPASKGIGKDIIKGLVATEGWVLGLLAVVSFPWAPECLGFSSTFDNPIRHPFIVISWPTGQLLEWDAESPPRPLRDRLLCQFATVHLLLAYSTCHNARSNAFKCFDRSMAERVRRIKLGMPDELTEKGCYEQLRLLEDALRPFARSPHLRDWSGYLAVSHAEIRPRSVFVNDNHDITCMTDWTFADTVPMARALSVPRFLWPGSKSDGSVSWDLTVVEDRRAYISFVKASTLPMAPLMKWWLDGSDADHRMLLVESCWSIRA